LAAITASCILGFDTTSLAHLYFLPFFSADPLNLCQVGWGASLHSYFQVSPEMFDRVQVQALSALSFVCVLRVVVLLEAEPLPQSEVLSALEQIFINYLSVLYFYFIYLLLNLYLTWQVS
jgi:hypothetical protein